MFRYNHTMNTRERIHKNWFFCRHFVLKWTRLPLTDHWIGSEKGILHFTLTEIGCPATGPGNLNFRTDSLPLFGLNETFLTGKSKASMMWGNPMPHEMNEFTKKVSSTLLKNTTGFVKKNTMSNSVCSFFLFAINKGNSCLFESCVQLQLHTE